MTWRDRQKRGTINEIPFEIVSNTLAVGRRTSIYQIPGSELGVGHVDNGRHGWRQSMNVITIGDDYDLARDRLIELFESEGPYVLVHPYYGRKNVVIEGTVSVSEASNTGGKAVFSFTTVEVANQKTPTDQLDTRGALKNAANATADTFTGSFTSVYKTKGFSNFVREAGVLDMQNSLAKLRGITGAVGTVLDVPSKFSAQLDQLTGEVVTLILAPGDLIDNVKGVTWSVASSISQVRSAFGSYKDSIARVGDLDEDAASLDNTDTPARRQEAINSRSWHQALKGITLAGLADALADTEFEFAQDARDALDAMTLEIESLIDQMSSADTTLETTIQDDNASEDAAAFQRLRDLQASLYDHLDAQAGAARELITYTPAESLPSVLIAYQLYGDATRHEEIESRNPSIIRNPNFVPGSVDIEVVRT